MTTVDRLKLIFCSIALVLFTASDLQGQDNTMGKDSLYANFIFDSKFLIGIPINEFRENLDQNAWGFGGTLLWRLKKLRSPVHLGASFSWLTYDRESDWIWLLDGDGFEYEVERVTRTSMFMGHLTLRIVPIHNTTFQPYFEGKIGFKNLYTRTNYIDHENPDFSLVDTDIEGGDFAFSYGGVVGLTISEDRRWPLIKFDISVAFLKGSAADYNVRSEDPPRPIIEPVDAFEERNSVTDLLVPQIGVSFMF